MKTKQETFDTVVKFLRAQGRAAMVGNKCSYRTPDGLKCAAGCLISDDEYKLSFEGNASWALYKQGVHSLDEHNTELVTSLQHAHDQDQGVSLDDGTKKPNVEPGLWMAEFLRRAQQIARVHTLNDEATR